MRRVMPFLCLALLVTSAAEANSWTKFAKKLKGKTKFDRKMNEMVVETGTDGTGGPITVNTAISLPELGLELPPNTTVMDSRKLTSRGALAVGAALDVSIHFDEVSGLPPLEVSFERFEPWIQGASQTQYIDGFTVRVRATDDTNGVKVIVTHDDQSFDTDVYRDDFPISVASEPFGPGKVIIQGASEFELPVDFPALETLEGASLLATHTAVDEAGQVVGQLISMDTVGDALQPNDIAKLALVENERGEHVLVAVTRSEGGAPGRLDLEIADSIQGPLFESSDVQPKAVEQLYQMETLTFEDPASAPGEVYGFLVTLFDADDNVLGSADFETLVSEPGEFAGTPFEFTGVAGPTQGMLGIEMIDDTNFALSVSVLAGSGARVEVEILDLVGNAALPESVSMAPRSTWARYRVRTGLSGPTGIAESNGWTIQAQTFDPESTLTDIAGGLIGEPTVLFRFGSGTKKAATTTLTKPQLL